MAGLGRARFAAARATALGATRSLAERQAEELLTVLGLAFETQVPVGRWVVDFMLTDSRTVIEVQGTYWHEKPAAKIRDARKRAFLECLGYRMIELRTDRTAFWWSELCGLSNAGQGYIFPSTI